MFIISERSDLISRAKEFADYSVSVCLIITAMPTYMTNQINLMQINERNLLRIADKLLSKMKQRMEDWNFVDIIYFVSYAHLRYLCTHFLYIIW